MVSWAWKVCGMAFGYGIRPQLIPYVQFCTNNHQITNCGNIRNNYSNKEFQLYQVDCCDPEPSFVLSGRCYQTWVSTRTLAAQTGLHNTHHHAAPTPPQTVRSSSFPPLRPRHCSEASGPLVPCPLQLEETRWVESNPHTQPRPLTPPSTALAQFSLKATGVCVCVCSSEWVCSKCNLCEIIIIIIITVSFISFFLLFKHTGI